MVREHTARVKQPRALFVPYPFGHPLGDANDRPGQLRVIRAALALLERSAGPVLEDLKAFYYAPRMAQTGERDFQAIARWFWAETALADLLRRIRDRMKATGDPALDAVAFGIAR